MANDIIIIAESSEKTEVTATAESPILIEVSGYGVPLVVTPTITKEVGGDVFVTVYPPQVINITVEESGQITAVVTPPSVTTVTVQEGDKTTPPPFRCCDAEDTPYDDPDFPFVSDALAELFRLAGEIQPPQEVTAANVSYTDSYPTVKEALDKLLYVAPAITSFSLSVGTVEIGSTVASLTASWAFNKAMTTATLTDATIVPTDTSKSFSGLHLTANKSYTLACSDGANSTSSIRTVSFSHKRYWGVSPKLSLMDSDILALSSEFSSSRGKSTAYNCTGGNYFYLCYPAALGAPANVTVGGLAFSDFTVTQQGFTNASGDTTLFNVVRCNLLQTGAAINVSWN